MNALDADRIRSKHENEFSLSRIRDELATLNFHTTLDNDFIRQWLNWQPNQRWKTCPFQSGWYCDTLDPRTEEPRRWGPFKPDIPRLDAKGKARKYEHPAGYDTLAIFLQVDGATWQTISTRYGIEISFSHENSNSPAGFWPWVRKHNLPIVICEGAKKAASLLSAGYIAIALPGVWNGRRKGSDLTPERLIPDLNHFATKRRKIYFCFDHDEKPKTVRHVNLAIAKTGKLFSEAGCDVRVILLPGPEKGVDDFIVTQGADAFEPLYKCALALESWQWHVRYRSRRTIQPWKTIEQAKLDLRTVGEMPERGVLFLESAKGTGKTHSISRLIRDRSKVVLLTHRIGLGRNLGQRFGVDWRTDLDRGFGGWIADGSRHTSRIGLCVDSLLAIDPQHFWDCDLVIDEIDQVLNHLLTSSTCNRDGKRPALLARLHEFIHVARRVIVASADITDDEIDYLKSLVESDVPVHLIRNTHIPDGYETTILDSKNESTAIAELLNSLAVGKKVFVATDSLQSSKAIAELLKQFQRTHPKFQFLTINSETSGGDIEAEFIRNVNECVRAFDCVVATPSLTTGISIDVEHFDLVVGLFRGVLDDADIAQALARVRPPIPRLVWCANSGKGFSKVSRSDTPSLLKAAIKTQWDRETRLMRTSLRPDISPLVEDNFDWDNNPHLNHWCRLVAHHNAALWNLRVNLIERLRWEGNQVNVLFVEENPVIVDRLKLAKETAKAQRCRAIAEARTLSPSELKALQTKDSRLPTDILNEQKTRLAEFYCEEDITPELVAFDDRGKLRGQIVELEALLHGKEFALKRDREALERQMQWQQGLFLPDQPCTELRRFVRDALGLVPYLNPDLEWSDEELEAVGECARTYRKEIREHLNFTIPEESEFASNGWIFRRLLSQLGVKVKTRRQGGRGEQVKLYRINREHWDFVQTILDRRQLRRDEAVEKEAVETPLLISHIQNGVATSEKSTTPSFVEGAKVRWLERAGEWVVESIGTATAFIKQVGAAASWIVDTAELQAIEHVPMG